MTHYTLITYKQKGVNAGQPLRIADSSTELELVLAAERHFGIIDAEFAGDSAASAALVLETAEQIERSDKDHETGHDLLTQFDVKNADRCMSLPAWASEEAAQ